MGTLSTYVHACTDTHLKINSKTIFWYIYTYMNVYVAKLSGLVEGNLVAWHSGSGAGGRVTSVLNLCSNQRVAIRQRKPRSPTKTGGVEESYSRDEFVNFNLVQNQPVPCGLDVLV
jgi:hypothetical protein